MPALDRINSAGLRIKEDALKSFVEREIKQLADRLRRIAARKPSSLRIRAFPAIASKDITKTHFPQSLFWTAILSAANRLQIGSRETGF